DSFRAGVAAAHAAGSRAMVYMNQRLWCTGTPGWSREHAARWAVKEKDGRVREETYNVFDPQPCATMDVTTPFWRAKYASIADTVLERYGVDGIYMDQAVQSLECWDSTHGHPVGGGTYWNYSSLVMPPYDELWPAQFAPPEPLALLDKRFRRQFYLEQARSFVWGLQPTIANFRASQLADRPEETAYLMRLARLRARTLDYLLYGTFLRPPELSVPSVDVDLSRVSIYAARRGGPTVSAGRYPAAIAGAWRAAHGSVAIAVASIVDQPMSVSFAFDPAAYGLSSGGQIEQLDERGRRPFGEFSSDALPIVLELPAGGAYVLEFRRSRRR